MDCDRRMYDYDDIFLFIKVMEAGSLSVAAKNLRLSVSTVSRRLQNAEAQLDMKLFFIQDQKFQPTDVGLSLYNTLNSRVYDIDNHIDDLKNKAGKISGSLKILVPPVVSLDLITPFLPEFKRKYPDIELGIAYINIDVDIVRQNIDVAILNHIPNAQNQRFSRLFDMHMKLYCTKEYAAKYGIPKTIDELITQNHLVTVWMHDDFSIGRVVKLVNVHTREVVEVQPVDASIAINNVIHGMRMMQTGEMISALFPVMVKDEDVINVLPDYETFDLFSYYLLKHPYKNQLLINLFVDFIESKLTHLRKPDI